MDLGLCVPMGNAFGMETSVPINRIGWEKLEFIAIPKDNKEEQIMRVLPEEPFAGIKLLKRAYLIRRGTIGIRVTDPLQDPPGNDRIP